MAGPIIPTLRYRDATMAVEWLSRAFSLTPHQVFRDNSDAVVHAELSFGTSMIMILPVADMKFGRFKRQPGDGGGVTASLYVIVSDPDAHCAQARAAGAEILLEPQHKSFGGRGYSARDPEAHIWSFGIYNPWVAKA